MVAQLLGLRLQLLANVFRRDPWQVFGIVLATMAGAGIVFLIGAALVGLRLAPDELTRNILVITGSFVVLGFVLFPLVFGIDDAMDPRKFALFGIRNRTLSTGLLVSALVSVPSVVLTVLSLVAVVTWSRGPVPVVFALFSAVLAVATCVLAARVTTAIASLLLATRRSRELTGVIGVLIVVLLAPAIILLSSVDWGREGAQVLGDAAEVVSWTPFGALWSIPGDAAADDFGAAALKLLIAVATVTVLWLIWDRLVANMLITTERVSTAKNYGGMGWFDVLPASPGAVIAARSITYWTRDPRYLVPLLIIPFAPIIMIAALLIVGVPVHVLALLPLPFIAIFLGWSLHNDLAFDSSAIWLHLSVGVRGTADRLGRTLPVFLIGIPVIVLGSMVTTVFFGDWNALPSVFGVSIALFLGGVGLSSYMSARFPYPAALPGDSPFQQPQASGTFAGLSQTLSLLGSIVVAIPAGIFAALGLTQDPSWHLISLGAGLVCGILAVISGVLIGGRVFDRRGPEIMAFAVSH